MNSCRTFFVSQSRKNLQRNLLVSLFLRVSKTFMHKKCMSGYFVEIFRSHSAQKNCTGIFHCFTDSGIEKSFELEG